MSDNIINIAERCDDNNLWSPKDLFIALGKDVEKMSRCVVIWYEESSEEEKEVLNIARAKMTKDQEISVCMRVVMNTILGWPG